MSIAIKTLFEKDIARRIDGVIKADDMSALSVELEEYIVTNEIEKKLEEFITAYNSGTDVNGTWISGFFGSGKSHLLKMLSLLLQNDPVDGREPLSYFEDKFGDNRILLADLKRAVAIPSQSILFNIDQQANVASSKPEEALLGVFVKAFDEMQGYYGKMPHIANFERDLDRKGHLEAFKAAFEEIAGAPWDQERLAPQLVEPEVAEAYEKATGRVIKETIFDDYYAQRSLSIDDFADMVKAYIDKKSKDQPGFRLNFFVDEVGQFIADNSKLMTNLQTIAESLSTKCKGRSWVVVTAQQGIDLILGDMNKNTDDFSKIMGRFEVKLPLNAADVAEVIQRRLLKKTSTAKSNLEDFYKDESENLKTMFAFTDGTRTLRGYDDMQHFVNSYPFHPYQYELFQDAIRGLSDQNAFEGKYTSTGARSMLGTFQIVAKSMMDEPMGRIASFDAMFTGVEKTLKANAQVSILNAENGLQDKFALRVLKALFLVKYVDYFKSTATNVAILMRDRFDLDPLEHRTKVANALSLLEREQYVQRDGDVYEYLTDEEKDIERKIRALELDSSEIAKAFDEMFFNEIIKAKSLRHEASKQDFAFTKRVDNALQGKEHVLGINLITPFLNEADRNVATLSMRSQADEALRVILPEEGRLMPEMVMYLKTNKYLSRASGTSKDRTAVLLDARRSANNTRRNRIVSMLKEQVGNADMMVRGEILDLRTSDPKGRIETAFQTLVGRVYTSLTMLRGVTYDRSDIATHLDQVDDGVLTEAEKEILNRVKLMASRSLRSTIESILKEMAQKPYGWEANATLCLTAMLIGRGQLLATRGKEALQRDDVLSALLDPNQHIKVELEPQEAMTAAQIMDLRGFIKDVLEKDAIAHDGKGALAELQAGLDALNDNVASWSTQKDRYPFVEALTPFAEALSEITGKPGAWYVTELKGRADDFADLKDDHYAPVETFFKGPQKDIFDGALKTLQESGSNLDFLETDLVTPVRDALKDPNILKGSGITDLKASHEALRAALRTLVAKEREDTAAHLRDREAKLTATPEFTAADADIQASVKAAIKAEIDRVPDLGDIAALKNVVSQFESVRYPQLVGQLQPAPQPAPPPAPEPMDTDPDVTVPTQVRVDPVTTTPPAPAPQMVAVRTLSVPFDKLTISSEEDIDAYVENMRKTLKDALASGKRISV